MNNMVSRVFSINLIFCLFLLFATISVDAQLKLPQKSPGAMVKQTIGLTDISVTYSRPSVKGRTIWGGLVPYDELWRAGANEPTRLECEDDIKLNGKELKAGTYAIFITPGKEMWKIHINSNHKQWGSGSYKPEEDVLVFDVKPQVIDHVETMSYSFTNIKDNSASLNMNWEKVSVSLNIEVEVEKKAWEGIQAAVKEAEAKKNARTFTQASQWCLENEMHLEEGKQWIEKSIVIEKNSFNHLVKGRYLAHDKNYKEAIEYLEEGIKLGKEKNGGTYKYEDYFNEFIDKWKGLM